MRFAAGFVAVAIAAYLWGGFTVYDQVFPYNQVQLLKNKYVGGSLTSSPRHLMFQAFSPKSDVVMVGDSLTAEAPWNEIFPGVQIANRGVDGDTTANILLRMDTILSVSPKTAMIMAGINDLRNSTAPDTVADNYQKIVATLRQAGIAVVIQSTLECNRRICGDAVVDQVQKLNAKLKGLADRGGLAYVDIASDLSSRSEGLLPSLTSDGVHLLPAGYVKWASKIRPYVLSAK
jgi:lysophospholipase L1-like esterase